MEFLKNLKNHFEIVIFTAAKQNYAEAIVKQLDPDKACIKYILSRNNCMKSNDIFVKDLRVISNRNLKKMVIVDNLVHSFGLQLNNGIPILEWKGERNDMELKFLENYLIELSKCEDIPNYNKNNLRLTELGEYDLKDLVF